MFIPKKPVLTSEQLERARELGLALRKKIVQSAASMLYTKPKSIRQTLTEEFDKLITKYEKCFQENSEKAEKCFKLQLTTTDFQEKEHFSSQAAKYHYAMMSETNIIQDLKILREKIGCMKKDE